jgi:hypothetical protein
MPITLTRVQIAAALPLVSVGHAKYLWLQGRVAYQPTTLHLDPTFQRNYNGFYKVQRRNVHWMTTYYALMGQAATEGLSFRAILDAIYKATARVEASFASKLFATLNISAPVIEPWVLVNAGYSLTAAWSKNRLAGVCQLHVDLATDFAGYLATPDGQYLVSEFTEIYGAVSSLKKCLIWCCG